MSDRERILVVLPNWVGDVVMATPTLRALRQARPHAHITWQGRRIALDTLADASWADDTLEDLSRGKPKLTSFFRQVRRIREGRYDTALLLPNSFRTAALVAAARIRTRVGYDRDGRAWLLTRTRRPLQVHGGGYRPISAKTYYADLVEVLGVSVSEPRMELFVSPADAAEAEALFAEAGITAQAPVVMLNPGASFGPSKMWEPVRFAAVADELMRRRGAQIIVNAAPSEKDIAAEVARHMALPPAISFAERDNTLGLLKAILARCDLLVTNDTGARHVGAALGAGVVTLFGSTDPRWSEIDYPLERQVRVAVPCSPCQSKFCLQPAGPKYHQCMVAIEPPMVLAACEDVLAATAASRQAVRV